MLRALALLITLVPCCALAGTWSESADVAVAWQSNASNATTNADAVGALQFVVNMATRSRTSLNAADAIAPDLHLTIEAWPVFSELTTIQPGAGIEWQHKGGLGPFAPTFFAGTKLDVLLARDEDRRGFFGAVSLGVRKRVTEATRLELSQEFSRVEAKARVYDRDFAETGLRLTHDWDEDLSLGLAVFWRYGDVVSHATPPRPDLVALARDRMNVSTFDRGFVVYSLRAGTIGGRVSLSRRFTEEFSSVLAYEFRRTERRGLEYVNHLVSLAAVRQF